VTLSNTDLEELLLVPDPMSCMGMVLNWPLKFFDPANPQNRGAIPITAFDNAVDVDDAISIFDSGNSAGLLML